MLSINTNLSSLIAQRSLKTSTNLLNQAVERMSTGYKINHSKDNAANYSITTNMDTQMSALRVAEDNAAMGLDLINTAEETLGLIQEKFERLRVLQTQASNDTYGEQSRKAINSEANALVDEIYRLYSSLEYNGITLSEPLSPEDSGIGADTSLLPTIEQTITTYAMRAASSPPLIDSVQSRDTSKMKKLSSVGVSETITSGTYSISTDVELAQLATMTNAGRIQGGEFVLANDIDLGAYQTGSGWTPIGANHWSENNFKATFDGNGYSISGLYINKPSNGDSGVGLFGCISGTVKNLILEDVNIVGQRYVGGIAGCMKNASSVENCTVTGRITGERFVGGVVGNCYITDNSTKRSVVDCYADVTLSGHAYGGIVGQSNSVEISNCISKGQATGSGANGGGGIVGCLYGGTVENCVSSLNITDNTISNGGVGGIIGVAGTGVYVVNCYASNLITSASRAGGIVGTTVADANTKSCNIQNCTFAGTVTSADRAGGILGSTESGLGGAIIEESTVLGSVNGANNAGGILGYDNSGSISINNCYLLGESTGLNAIYIGSGMSTSTVKNCYSSSYYQTLGIADAGGDVVVQSSVSYDPNASSMVMLQVGTASDSNSQITLEASVGLSGIRGLRNLGVVDKDYTQTIDNILANIGDKLTQYGSVSNRLESVLDEITIRYENLYSSCSTLRDADIAEVSSQYIQQQILQQASATLMATANQSPSIALQLI